MNESIYIKDSIFRIGKVTSVEGRAVRVSVDKAKNSSHLLFKGELIKNVSVGSYIKIIKGFTKIICKVEGEYVNEDSGYSKMGFSNEKDKIDRCLRVSLLGFFNSGVFERGIKEMPLIDNECYLLDREEFDAVHHFIKPKDKPLLIGQLSLEKGQEIKFGIDSLFASHIGIFGNTGSGKSYTLAKIYFELFELYKNKPKFVKNARFFLLDFNGEYVDDEDNVIVEKNYKDIYKLSTGGSGDKFPISKNAVYDPDFWKVILEATEKTQVPFLKRALNQRRYEARLSSSDSTRKLIKAIILSIVSKKDKDVGPKIVFDFLSELDKCLVGSNLLVVRNNLISRLNSYGANGAFFYINPEGVKEHDEKMKELVALELDSIQLPTAQLDVLSRLRLQFTIQYYDEIVKGHANREHLSPIIKRMESRFKDIIEVIKLEEQIEVPMGEQAASQPAPPNLTIVSLKDVNIDMKKILPLLFCKQLYADQKNNDDGKSYLNIIIDEAHNILSRDSTRESEQWKDYRLETFEEIIKEGRKFGVFLTLASQRPSDISATIISQLHNYFLHRLINNNDILAVEKTISYLDRVSFEYLPILPTGTCIVAGMSAQVPVVIDIGRIPEKFEPNNKTRGLIENWE